MTVPLVRIAPPRAPEPAAPFHFPVIATIAPLVVSMALFAITRSPFTLMFAALGPVIAVASLADSRIGSRRTRKREALRFDREFAAAGAEIAAAHDAEHRGRREITPGAAAILERTGADPYRWRALASHPVLVSVGSGSVRSGLELEPGAAVEDAIRLRLEDLRASAASLVAPVAVDARLGIGIVGPEVIAGALLRAIVVQLAWSLPPPGWSIGSTGAFAGPDWLRALPHEHSHESRGPAAIAGRPDGVEFRSADGTDIVRVATARTRSELPASCRVVVEFASGAPPAIVGHPDPEHRVAFRTEVVSDAEARTWAPILAAAADREGLVSPSVALPTSVAFASLVSGPADVGSGLRAAFAVGASGPIELDLVEHGPHAIVGGTTGSGKSELLIAWVLALAARHPPDRVSFLLVDFKGGSAFAPLEQLPHTVGVMTDLDELGALRALESLRAELRFRERALAETGARDISGCRGCRDS